MDTPPRNCLFDRCVSNCSCKSGKTTGNTVGMTNEWRRCGQTQQHSCICIPRLDLNINKEYVTSIIDKLYWGHITNVSTVVNQKNPALPFVSVFINIMWLDNNRVKNIRQILSGGHAVKVVHNNFNVWKIYEKKNNIHIHNN